MLTALGSPQEAPTQIGTVTPMRALFNNKAKYWNTAPEKWDGKDPRYNGSGRELPAFVAEVAEHSGHTKCRQSIVLLCNHYIVAEDHTINEQLKRRYYAH